MRTGSSAVVWTRTETDALLSMLDYGEMRRSGGTNTEGVIRLGSSLARASEL